MHYFTLAEVIGAMSTDQLTLASICYELGETRNEETPEDKDQDGTSRIHGD